MTLRNEKGRYRDINALHSKGASVQNNEVEISEILSFALDYITLQSYYRRTQISQ
jgi:hypothetical protein